MDRKRCVPLWEACSSHADSKTSADRTRLGRFAISGWQLSDARQDPHHAGRAFGSDAYWDGDDYILEVHGEMREAELFGENMVLRRRIRSVYGTPSITVEDEVTNESLPRGAADVDVPLQFRLALAGRRRRKW